MKSSNHPHNRPFEKGNETDPEQKALRAIWDKAGDHDLADQISLSNSERSGAKDAIFSTVSQQPERTEKGRDTDSSVSAQRSKTGTVAGRIGGSQKRFSILHYAAAAVILIALGITYIYTPVTRTAPRGDHKIVRLPDGSRVHLNSGSTVNFSRLFGYTNRDLELEGEAFFDVASDDVPFAITTFNSRVEVLGTRFNLRAWPDEPTPETVVALEEGSLAFGSTNGGSEPLVLKPGEAAKTGAESTSPTMVDGVSIDQQISWMQNRFVFEERPLYAIIPELERRFDITISVESPRFLTDSLTIYYSEQVKAEQIIRDICLSQGLRYRKINNGYAIEGQ